MQFCTYSIANLIVDRAVGYFLWNSMSQQGHPGHRGHKVKVTRWPMLMSSERTWPKETYARYEHLIYTCISKGCGQPYEQTEDIRTNRYRYKQTDGRTELNKYSQLLYPGHIFFRIQYPFNILVVAAITVFVNVSTINMFFLRYQLLHFTLYFG